MINGPIELVPSSGIVGLRCVLVGSEALLAECGQHLERSGFDILAVVSDRQDIVDWATGRSLRVLPNVAALLAATDLPGFDYLFSITNLWLLGPEVLALPTRAAINFHDGPLPEMGGVNTPSWALIEGASGHGVTWHLMLPEVDAGGVLARRRFALDAGETALSLHRKNFAAGLESFEDLVNRLVSVGPVAIEPATPPRRLYRRSDRPEAAGTIRWDQRAERIDRIVRGLDFGTRPNPLGTAKAIFENQRLIVRGVTMTGGASGLPPGTIVRASDKAIVVATGSNDIAVHDLADADGKPVALSDALARYRLRAGAAFDVITTAQAQEVSAIDAQIAVHEGFWSRRLVGPKPLDLPNVNRRTLPGTVAMSDQLLLASGDPVRSDTVLAALVASLARLADTGDFDVGFSCPLLAAPITDVADWFAPQLPLRVAADLAGSFDAFRAAVLDDMRQLRRRIGHAADLAARTPGASATPLPVSIVLVDQFDDAVALSGSELTVAIVRDGSACRWLYDDARFAAAGIAAMQRQFSTLLDAADADPGTSVADLPLLDTEALAALIDGRNATTGSWRSDACIHHLIAEQARRTPDQVAVTCKGQSLTYAELNAAAARWAHRLRALGVRPDSLVGIFVERSVDLVVGVLAVLKAGGAYVPLDPAYPADRIAHMIADAQAGVIVTHRHLVERLPQSDATLLCLDEEVDALDAVDGDDSYEKGGATPANLAYVIYTSGSTGRPKGVMVEHRNAVNFFAGMDARVPAPGVWLAVTSLSFDISVLELCWTLTRGFTVVIYTGDDRQAAPEVRPAMAARPLDFSLFYFASDASESATDKYRLLLEGAKYGDREGFCGVWTPERHFHAFGGLYPNPAVTSAAIAAVTSRIGIRAGSCVLPLHHPIRVAEDWSVVDNLSNGRVSISFAAGWQPDDFVLAPENFRTNKEVMLRDIDVVRRLWRGEAVAFPGPLGNQPEVTILPRPVQPELPFWLTSAGNVETFEAAGRIGASVLTHLLGQTVEELTDKLAAYRRAWREAGHPGNGRAALMLHSFVGDDEAMVRATVRQPMIDYLRSSASLIKQYAWSFPAFKRRAGMDGASGGVELDGLDADEMAALLDHAFERYYETSGLFGTPDGCMAMVDRIKRAGVDEIACLIDFGIDSATVMAHLPQLNAVRQAALPRAAETMPAADTLESQDIPALIDRHGVTHLQCTPSMASLLMADDRAHPALATLKALLVGGEAFPPALADDLARLVGGSVMNMYGPTETTIWSTTATLDSDQGSAGSVSLGTPLLNQQVYILDSRGRPVPDGIPGELVIGGAGVTRGYLGRPDLTADRFVPHPFGGTGKIYRTGDLARFDGDGRVEFLGRLDNQVKIRGHRIELGEIEAELAALPGVDEAVVVARASETGDVRLIGYVTGTAAGDLRDRLRQCLPDVMVPPQIVTLAAMPRTPNGKIDRKALPAPETVIAAPVVVAEPPAEGVEARIAAIWCNVLKLPSVGANDNFFDLGGHSLLAVQVHRQLRDGIGHGLAIIDIFRYPTIRALAERLANGDDNRAAVMGQNRASERLAAMGRRRAGIPATAVNMA
ncbi:LLM class flavin-dependent oxidoreductase [Sphingosinicellaceae bacterium]|nr:LLM class flavin-dependent oxidoreductase [Sphingosinicellaceae bacterium]